VGWSTNDELALQLVGEADEVKGMFESFRAASPALYTQLVQSVADGVGSMKQPYYFFWG
jgi:hypothetical protein